VDRKNFSRANKPFSGLALEIDPPLTVDGDVTSVVPVILPDRMLQAT
jgi:hypothetical protein